MNPATFSSPVWQLHKHWCPAILLHAFLCLLLLCAFAPVYASSDWHQLSSKQQELLEPLQREWPTMSPAQRDRWLRLGQRYESQPPNRQALMRERVSNWNELSPHEKARARENFKALQNTQKGERNSQWNRYQSLENMQRERFRERMEQTRPEPPHHSGQRR